MHESASLEEIMNFFLYFYVKFEEKTDKSRYLIRTILSYYAVIRTVYIWVRFIH